MSKDYYNILGVTKTATKDDIKKAFHKKAHEHHPDKKGGDEAKFKEVNEAYQILSNDQKRSQYDQFGQSFNGAGPQPGAGGFGGFGGAQGGVEFDMGDIFSEFFGGQARGRSRASQGKDIHIDVTISLSDAVSGIERDLVLYKHITCKTCDGVGGDKSSKSTKCTTCNGTGKVTRVQQTILGNIQTSGVCSHCQGGGMMFEKDCATCKGLGVKKEEKTLKISVPAGIDSGQMIRVSGEGEAVKKGQPGDLIITVYVSEDARFRREGPHLYTTVPVAFSIATLGGSVDVETVDDSTLTLKIPAGTQSGKVFRVPGRGVGLVNSTRKGDLLVTAQIATPTKISRKQKKLFQELEKEGF